MNLLPRLAALSVGTAILAASAPVFSQAAPAAKLVPAQSEISFTSRQMGVPVDGRFKRFDAQIALDPKAPETGRVAFTVDLASVTMGADDVEAELAKPAWFDTQKAATATFASSGVKAAGGGKFEVAGKLTIKGNARDVIVPVTVAQSGGTSTATGQFTLKRLAYKIGEGDWSDTSMVADDVIVKFKLALTGLPPI